MLDGLTEGQSLGSDLAALISPTPAFEEFLRGVIGLPALLHLLAFTVFFLWTATRCLDRKGT